MELGYKNRKYLDLIVDYYSKDVASFSYVDAVWSAYQDNKAKLDEYDAFLAKLIEDELLADRRRILKCLRKGEPYDLCIKELWKKYLIRFPQIKKMNYDDWVEMKHGKVLHYATSPYWHFKFEYEMDGKTATDYIVISTFFEGDEYGNEIFYNIDKFFLQVFIVMTAGEVEPLNYSSLYDREDMSRDALIKMRKSEDRDDEGLNELLSFELGEEQARKIKALEDEEEV